MEFLDNYRKPEAQKSIFKVEENANKFLGVTYDVITYLLYLLQERPDFVFKILKHCSKLEEPKNAHEREKAKEDARENLRILSSFFTERFYENILSSSTIEDELLCVFFLSFQREINAMRQRDDSFSFLSRNLLSYYLCNGLVRSKYDITSFFSLISKSIVEKLESIDENSKFDFNLEKLNKVYNEKGLLDVNAADYERRSPKKKPSKLYVNRPENFCENFTKADLMKLSLDLNQKDTKMNEFIDSQILFLGDDEEGFTNYKFLLKIAELRNGGPIFEEYKTNFNICKELISDVILMLIKNINIIPYYIKCLCKIISILAEKKFGDLKCYEKNIFVSNFFFGVLLKPFFVNLDFNIYLDSWTISENTKHNLEEIFNILKKLVSGKLYLSGENSEVNYTPFNGFMINIMPKVFEFFSLLIDVKLPNIIDKLINESISNESFVYEYFKENPSSGIKHYSICCNYDEIIRIIKVIKKFKPAFIRDDESLDTTFCSTSSDFNKKFNPDTDSFDTLFSKLYERMTSENTWEYLQNNIQNEIGKNVKTFIILQKTKFSNYLSGLNEVNSKNPVFTYKQIYSPNEENKNYNLITAKNFFCKILFYFQDISKEIFIPSKIKDTDSFLEVIKSLSKADYYLLSNDIPLDWYISSLKKILRDIPDAYIQNDYSLLYDEIISELKKAIEGLGLNYLGEIEKALSYVDKAKISTNKYLSHLNKLDINNKIEEFIKEGNIPITMHCNEKDKKFFSFSQKVPKNELMKLFTLSKDSVIVKNIQGFIDNFPNFVEIYKGLENIKMDLFGYMQSKGVSNTINLYFKIVDEAVITYEGFKSVFPMELIKDINEEEEEKEIKSKIKKSSTQPGISYDSKKDSKKDTKKQKLKEIFKKIKDDLCLDIHSYIMNKLYDKLYFKEVDERDNNLFKICISLQWVEQQHLISDSKMILDNFLPGVINHFKKLEYKKSPTEKINLLQNIAELIQSTIVFSTGKSDNSVDDNTPFLLYAIIKSKPKNLCSNLRYIEEFLDEAMAMDNRQMLLIQYTSATEILLYFNWEKLNGISQEEYNKNCEKCLTEYKPEEEEEEED
ncbi:MAG: hypothetical protein MJ252_05785 [archaeon]|nr:hypothetical protein [archaeon]